MAVKPETRQALREAMDRLQQELRQLADAIAQTKNARDALVGKLQAQQARRDDLLAQRQAILDDVGGDP